MSDLEILRLPQVSEKTKLSIPTIRKKIDDGTFPRPVELSNRAIGWTNETIEAWINNLPIKESKNE